MGFRSSPRSMFKMDIRGLRGGGGKRVGREREREITGHSSSPSDRTDLKIINSFYSTIVKHGSSDNKQVQYTSVFLPMLPVIIH